jgi:outer membrane lipoprotein carrier protein
VLIADGRNVWFYDRDLQQVTVKPADAALSATPIMLLSGGAEVRKAFAISDAGAKDGLSWLRVKPRAAEADFRQAVLGFAGGELKQMILEDKLGQQATLTFSRSQRNAPVTEAEVSFTPPQGVDVIGKPQQ